MKSHESWKKVGQLSMPAPALAYGKRENVQPSTSNQEKQRVKGIEPSCAAWEAAVLPLNYTRVFEELNSESFCE
jgi:hypothetical protein